MELLLTPTLAQKAASGQLGHAYILTADSPQVLDQASKALAGALLCEGERPPCGECKACRKVSRDIHPDVITITPEAGKDLTVGQIRDLRRDAYTRPNEGKRKIYRLENAQRMNPSAQNALLKVLEEGPSYAVFLLLTENPNALLETIRSRCETVRLGNGMTISQEEKEQQAQLQQKAGLLAGLLLRGDRWGLIQFTIGYEKAKWEELAPLLEETRRALITYRNRENTPKAVELAGRLQELIAGGKVNLNVGAALGWLWSLGDLVVH